MERSGAATHVSTLNCLVLIRLFRMCRNATQFYAANMPMELATWDFNCFSAKIFDHALVQSFSFGAAQLLMFLG